MPRFFVGDIAGSQAVVTGEDAVHITKSLRMQPGEELILCDGKGSDYKCSVINTGSEVVAEVLEKLPNQTEPSVSITLYQALPKGDKLDFIVQKAVELGAVKIVPVLSSRCISRPDKKSMEKKLLRLRRTALEAAKQSGRGIMPDVGALISFETAVKEAAGKELGLFFYEEAKEPLHAVLEENKAKEIAVFIGSEGGFSPEEADLASRAGLHHASLGPRILRCETAPVCALSAILYAYKEF